MRPLSALCNSLFVLLVLCFGWGIAEAQSPPRLIADKEDRLVGMKDPGVVMLALPEFSQEREPYLLLGDYMHNRLRAFRMVDFEAREEIALKLPPLKPGFQRWAPCALVEGDTIWLYYTMGDVAGGIKWPTFRIYVAKGRIPREAPVREITFDEEREVVLLTSGEFNGAKDYGIIDAELFRDDDGQLYIYYNVVLAGIPKVRHRSSPIRSQRMHDYVTAFGQDDEKRVWDDQPGEDGVAEAPAIIKRGGRYLMFYSSRGSDRDQCVALLESDRPHGAPWTNRRIISSTRADDKPAHLATEPWERLGVGGQCVFEKDGKVCLLYQGLGALEAGEPPERNRFRAAVMEYRE